MLPIPDPSRSLGDASHVPRATPWVDLEDLCSRRDRHIVVGNAAQEAVEWRPQDRRANLRQRFPGADHIADLRGRPKYAVDRCIHVAIAGMTGDGARLTGQRERRALRDHRAKVVPARVIHNVSVATSDE